MKVRRFTGWHMTTILVAFFGVVLAVNVVMARYAIGTFGGTVVNNSYVASQKYNGWLDAAERQAKLGWTVRAALNEDRHLFVTVDKDALPLGGLAGVATIHHPLGRQPTQTISLAPAGEGRLVSVEPLPAGRWDVRLEVSSGGHRVRTLERL